jgi:hypothetical protein
MKNVVKYTPFVAFFCAIGYVSFLLSDKNLFATDVEEKDILKNETKRGILVSVFSAILMNIVGAVFVQLGVPKNKIVFNYGFIYGPVIGYMMDMGFGKQQGLELFLDNKAEWSAYVMKSLADIKFVKYVVTVLLDMFISSPIQDVLQMFIKPVRNQLLQNNNIGKFTGGNMPSIVQSIVAFITFNAYTNHTRFSWAYQDKTDSHVDMSISLATALSAALFLIYNLPNATSRNERLYYVIFTFVILTIVDQFKEMNILNPEIAGSFIFLAFTVFGVVVPLMSIRNLNK